MGNTRYMKITKEEMLKDKTYLDELLIDEIDYKNTENLINFICNLKLIIKKYNNDGKMVDLEFIHSIDLSNLLSLHESFIKYFNKIEQYYKYYRKIENAVKDIGVVNEIKDTLKCYSDFNVSFNNFLLENNIDKKTRYLSIANIISHQDIQYNDNVFPYKDEYDIINIFNTTKDMKNCVLYNFDSIIEHIYKCESRTITMGFSSVISTDYFLDVINMHGIDSYYNEKIIKEILLFKNVNNDSDAEIIKKLNGNRYLFFISLYNQYQKASGEILKDDQVSELFKYFVYCNTIQKNNFQNKKYINELILKNSLLSYDMISNIHEKIFNFDYTKYVISNKNLKIHNYIKFDLDVIVNNYISNIPDDFYIKKTDFKYDNIKKTDLNINIKMVIFKFLIDAILNDVKLTQENEVKLNKILFSEKYIDGDNFINYAIYNKKDGPYKGTVYYSDKINSKKLFNFLLKIDNVLFSKKIIKEEEVVNFNKKRYNTRFNKFMNNISEIFHNKIVDVKIINEIENKQKYLNVSEDVNNIATINYQKDNVFEDNIVYNKYLGLKNLFELLNKEKHLLYLSTLDKQNITSLYNEIQDFITDNNNLYEISNNKEKKEITINVMIKIDEITIILEEKLNIVKQEIKNKIKITEQMMNSHKNNIL